MAHPGGQPTKYRPEYCAQIIEYFRRPPENIHFKKEYNKDGSIRAETPIITGAEFPSFQGFADSIEVHVDTLHEWKATRAEFSEAYSRAKQIQEDLWLTNAMNNRYNAQFAQFFGKNCLGYKDKIEVDARTIGVQLVPDSIAQLPIEELHKLLGAAKDD